MNTKKSNTIFLLTVVLSLCYSMLIFGAIQLAKIYGKLPLFIVGMVMYLIGKFIYFKRMKND